MCDEIFFRRPLDLSYGRRLWAKKKFASDQFESTQAEGQVIQAKKV